MMDAGTVVVLALATHRLYVCYFNDTPLARVRELLGRYVASKLGYCGFCLSFWIPAVVLLLWFAVPHGWVVISVLALSNAIGFLDDLAKTSAVAQAVIFGVQSQANGHTVPAREEAQT